MRKRKDVSRLRQAYRGTCAEDWGASRAMTCWEQQEKPGPAILGPVSSFPPTQPSLAPSPLPIPPSLLEQWGRWSAALLCLCPLLGSPLRREHHLLQWHCVLPGLPQSLLQLPGLRLADHRPHWSRRPPQPQPAADRALWRLHHRLVGPPAISAADGAWAGLSAGSHICLSRKPRVG